MDRRGLHCCGGEWTGRWPDRRSDAESGTPTYDSQCWLKVPEYREFVERSPMAEIAGQLLDASAVNFFFDSAFLRAAEVQFRTPFHQDEPYWPLEGFDTCSAWTPLVPVVCERTLEFVRGSHRWNQRYRQQNFDALTGDDRDQVGYGADDERVPLLDIEDGRDVYEILGGTWNPETWPCSAPGRSMVGRATWRPTVSGGRSTPSGWAMTSA